MIKQVSFKLLKLSRWPAESHPGAEFGKYKYSELTAVLGDFIG
jgi:hypothetical protein